MPGAMMAVPATSSGRLIAASIASRDRPPGRNSATLPSRQATIVDSTPMGQGPPSRIMSTTAPRSATTSRAVVGLSRPDRLAEGATIGRPARRNRSSARGWFGIRRPTLANPAQARSQTDPVRARGSTRVSGPGQNRMASRSASGVKAASLRAWSRVATWAMSGLNIGRPLAAKIPATASGAVASAPRP